LPILYSLSDTEVTDSERRRSMFAGNLFVYSPRPVTVAFASVCRVILEQTLGGDPVWAQQRMSEAEFAALFYAAARGLSQIALQLASGIVADLGCDPDMTYVGRPALVATTGFGFLAHGLGAPQHPHRDTWYAAAPCQVNWWVPLHDLESSASFAFHPVYWREPVQNSSGSFDYAKWYDHHEMGQPPGQTEPLAQPRPLDPIDLTPEIRISCLAGGVIMSSVAQLYSAVPNEDRKTHFNVHFQTVNRKDLDSGAGARNLDAEPKGSSLTHFVRCRDLVQMPEELVRRELEHRRPAQPP